MSYTTLAPSMNAAASSRREGNAKDEKPDESNALPKRQLRKKNERDPVKKGERRGEGGTEEWRKWKVLDLALDVNFAKGFCLRRLEC